MIHKKKDHLIQLHQNLKLLCNYHFKDNEKRNYRLEDNIYKLHIYTEVLSKLYTCLLEIYLLYF